MGSTVIGVSPPRLKAVATAVWRATALDVPASPSLTVIAAPSTPAPPAAGIVPRALRREPERRLPLWPGCLSGRGRDGCFRKMLPPTRTWFVGCL
jgi:hypothetical protein